MTFILIGLSPQDRWKGRIEIIDGVSHILNPDKGMRPNFKIKFEKEWEIGLEEGDKNYIFETIAGIDVDDEGKVYILDYKACNIRIFSPDGRYLKTIGRRGKGPGEFENPVALSLNKKGGFVVGESMPPRLTFFDSDGTYLKNVKLGFIGLVFGIQSINRDQLLLEKIMSEFKNDKVLMNYILCVIDGSGENIADIFSMQRERNINMKNLSERDTYGFSWCVDLKGNVLIVDDIYNYNIKVYTQRGIILRVIQREFKSIKRTKKDLNRIQSELEARKRQLGLEIQFKLSEIKPIINSIFTDDENRLWVVTPEGAPEDGTAFDIFDEEGRYIAKTTIDAKGTGNFIIKNNHIYFSYQSEDTFPTVYKFKILERR